VTLTPGTAWAFCVCNGGLTGVGLKLSGVLTSCFAPALYPRAPPELPVERVRENEGRKMKMLKRQITLSMIGAILAVGPAWGACDPDRIQIPASRYEINGAEVRDKETGLTWQRCSVGQTWREGAGCTGTVQEFDWPKAMRQARGGWRIPTRDELSTLISFGCSPSINPDVFPNLDPLKLWYWSSSREKEHERELAWLVQFGGGATFNGYQTSLNAVRLVRGGKER
jgi:hypothetical protein